MQNSLKETIFRQLDPIPIKFYGILGLMVFVFGPLLWQLMKVWVSDEDYSHGSLVIPISLYLLWKKRSKLLSITPEPSWIGFFFFIGFLLIYIVSFITRFHTLTYVSMVGIIIGISLFLMGRKWAKEILIPVFFLFFMFPIPSAYYILITNPLKLLITKISSQLIYFLGIPVYIEGNLLYMASIQLEIVEACSGLRSIYSYLMLGVLFALMCKGNAAKVLLILSAIPLALFINIFRVTGTGVLAELWGDKISQGFYHEFSGLILFFAGVILFFLEFALIDKYLNQKKGS